MKSEFKAKYLQHLARKHKGNEGFTLIELLVVIIIVGVLAAIALPSFLNQIGKARGSEAKSSIGTINRSQQSYRLENSTFSNALTNLDAKITGKFYSYSIPQGDAGSAAVVTTPTTVSTGLKVSSGFVAQTGDNFQQAICESQNTSAAVSSTMTSTACPANYSSIQ